MASLVRITGVVQGVGFRPHIYRRATARGLSGWVANDAWGVLLYLEADPDTACGEVGILLEELPPLAKVDEVTVVEVASRKVDGFSIAPSLGGATTTAEIARDIAVCADCLAEMRDPADRRHGYPYISCTNCGPRYSVMTALPYDRTNTTMAPWELCADCLAEYTDPNDRRFHAEPIACPACGPNYRIHLPGAELPFEPGPAGAEAIAMAARLLAEGRIVAVKGIGGYHLACDARNADAVRRLREAKFRKEKPFALMAKDLGAAARLAEVSIENAKLLGSPSAPIVLLPAVENLEGIAPETDLLGVMLAYTPLHHLLFDAGAPEALVMTSGNRSSEPIAYRDDEALGRFGSMAEAVLAGERPIARRLDDSLYSYGGPAPVLRRSRGMAPSFCAELPSDAALLGCGADLKGSVALGVSGRALVSQFLGDLEFHEVQQAHRETVLDLLRMYAIDPSSLQLCADAHPRYFSRTLADAYAQEFGAAEPLLVQHHRAHVASVLAERGMWESRVVGVALDGTGFGDDGTIWGGEFFVGSLRQGLARRSSLERAQLLGGEAAVRRPMQALAGFVADDELWKMFGEPVFGLENADFRALSGLRRRPLGAVATTSAGRLFDAVAAICGFTRSMTFEGQAAMWLESLARAAGAGAAAEGYAFETTKGGALGFQGVLAEAAHDRLSGVPVGEIALSFHLGFASAVAGRAASLALAEGIGAVVLSGGVFQNRLLAGEVERLLTEAGLGVWMNATLSCNDENISLGQIAIGAAAGGRGRG
ncbi:MAG: carbamoyltransferase HypF [Actinomycetota bacterium]|nr:carbamoyltransferase HypF [Actinomycetota bacterium]